MSDSWEVKAIQCLSDGMWMVWWAVGGTSTISEDQLDGVDVEYLTHGSNHVNSMVLLDVTHLKEHGRALKVKTVHCAEWVTVQRDEILPNLMSIFESLPVEQRRRGVPFHAESRMSLSCCPFAVVSLFPQLSVHSSRFVTFEFGAVAGPFIHWLHRSFFGQYRIRAAKFRFRRGHPVDYLLSTERQAGEKYFLLLSNNHAVGVEIDSLGPVMHCAMRGKNIPFNWDTVAESGGKVSYRGCLWQLKLIERTF